MYVKDSRNVLLWKEEEKEEEKGWFGGVCMSVSMLEEKGSTLCSVDLLDSIRNREQERGKKRQIDGCIHASKQWG